MGQEPWPKPEALGGAAGLGPCLAEKLGVLDSGLQGPCENTFISRKKVRVGGVSIGPSAPKSMVGMKEAGA